MKNYLKLTSILPLAILLLIPAVSSAETIAGYQSYSSSNGGGTTAQYQSANAYNSSGSTASYSNYYQVNSGGSSPYNNNYYQSNTGGTVAYNNYNSANTASVIASQGNYNQTASVVNSYPNLPKTGGGGKSQTIKTPTVKSKLSLWATISGICLLTISLFIAFRKNEEKELNIKN
jgi:hypothetical protein